MNELNRYSRFNIEKIVQIFGYIQHNTETQSKLELIKYLFFADRINLRRHFSFVSRDTYYALKMGPVASGALDVLNKEDAYFNYPDDELASLDKITMDGPRNRIINETNTDLLSKNELASIDFAVNTFKGKPLVDLAHEYPEWKHYKDLFVKGLTSKEPIRIEDFFTNPVLDDSPFLKRYFGIDPLYENEAYLSEAREFYFERHGVNG